MRLDDPNIVEAQYSRPERLAARAAVYAGADGPDPIAVALEWVADCGPQRILEVGCGWGGLAERMARELGAQVVALDLSPQMVELARQRGVDARVGDVQALPFAEGEFDCAVAAWMLYHVPALDRGLAELARVLRPGGRLVAITNGSRHLSELWELVDGYREGHEVGFWIENGSDWLEPHFARVGCELVSTTLVFPDRETVAAYVAASVTRAHLADRVPLLDGPLRVTREIGVFVADR